MYLNIYNMSFNCHPHITYEGKEIISISKYIVFHCFDKNGKEIFFEKGNQPELLGYVLSGKLMPDARIKYSYVKKTFEKLKKALPNVKTVCPEVVIDETAMDVMTEKPFCEEIPINDNVADNIIINHYQNFRESSGMESGMQISEDAYLHLADKKRLRPLVYQST